MNKKKFTVVFSVAVELEIDEEVLKDAQSEDFRASFYKLDDDAAVARHLAYNLVSNRVSLSHLDGFAHWDMDRAKLVDEDWDFVECTEEAGS
jgi:hypothetical protein